MTARLRTLATVPAGLVLAAGLLAGCNNGAAGSSTPSETMMEDGTMSATPSPSDAMMDETHDESMSPSPGPSDAMTDETMTESTDG